MVELLNIKVTGGQRYDFRFNKQLDVIFKEELLQYDNFNHFFNYYIYSKHNK